MPVGLPPLGGPLGRSRGRLSASSLTTYLRCPRQWLLGYVAGLRGPLRPSQIIGVIVEDALCRVLMHHPPAISDEAGLRAWVAPLVTQEAALAHETGRTSWEQAVWTSPDATWADVTEEGLATLIMNGVDLFLDEVQQCVLANGGPHLEAARAGEAIHSVPAPTWGSPPHFPRPEKVPSHRFKSWPVKGAPAWSPSGSPVGWSEGWELARPWFKDPRVHQPQRLFHPEGWAAGELDLVLRWKGTPTLVDIKSGTPSGPFSISLKHQLEFYAWLWAATHDDDELEGLEGWYLGSKERLRYDAPDGAERHALEKQYKEVHRAMLQQDETVVSFPAAEGAGCDGTAPGCIFCSITVNGDALTRLVPSLRAFDRPAPAGASMSLSDVQGRVNVRGGLTGAWGPLPNHFGESVNGMVLVAGDKHIVVEEAEPGSFPDLHAHVGKQVVIRRALPGVWRDQPRLYLDNNAQIELIDDGVDLTDITRLGLLRTRANVRGHVLSVQRRDGVRLDGKPWAMLSFVLWDGSAVAETVAFGSSMSRSLLSLKPGDAVTLTGAELGWRGGVLQLRIDNRKTRVEHRPLGTE